LSDDESTPVSTPRARRSSVSVSTAELVLESLAARLSLPALSPSDLRDEDREDAVAIVLDHCRAAASRAIASERRECDRLRAELRTAEERLVAVQRELARARNAMRSEE